MSVNLKWEITGPEGGRFDRWSKRRTRDLAIAVTAAVTETAENVKEGLRDAIVAANLGRRLPNTVTSQVYPKGKVSLGAAAVVRIRSGGAARILESFAYGATITAKGKRYLAIPTDEGRHLMSGRRRATPARLMRDHPNLQMRLVTPRGRNPVIVARLGIGQGRRRGFRVKNKARPTAEIVIFTLVPQVQIRKRFDPLPIVNREVDKIPNLIEAALPNE